jgi:hypothetical protein
MGKPIWRYYVSWAIPPTASGPFNAGNVKTESFLGKVKHIF